MRSRTRPLANNKLEPIIRKSLIDDLDREKPRAAHWDEWIEGKATQYSVPQIAVKKYLTTHLERMDVGISLASMPIAQRIAASLGATRSRALQTLNRALDATRTRSVKLVGGGEGAGRYQEVTEPDWDVRCRAANDLLKVYGGFAPQMIEVRHGIVEELSALSDEQIVERYRAALAAAQPPEQIEAAITGPIQ